jgi:hypothetical protein
MGRPALFDDAALLAGILRELGRLRAIYDDPARFHALGYYSPVRGQARDADRGILTVDFPAWLGRGLTDAERRAALRALERLEAGGKVRRIADGYTGNRTTCIAVVTPKRRKRKGPAR